MHPELAAYEQRRPRIELFKEALRLYKVVGRKQLTEVAHIFNMNPAQVQAVHLGMLLNDEDLPMLSVQQDWLSQV